MAAGYLLTNTLELLASDPETVLLWAFFSFLFSAALPVTWLAFALQYAGRTRWLSPGRFWVFCVVPLLSFLVLTTQDHRLVWQSVALLQVEGFQVLSISYGPWFWVQMLYSYSLLIAGAVLIGREYFFSHRIYRRQSLWMVAGLLIPVVYNFIFVLRVFPGLSKDYSPLAFALTGLAFAMGIFRYRLLNLMPVARNVLVDTLSDRGAGPGPGAAHRRSQPGRAFPSSTFHPACPKTA